MKKKSLGVNALLNGLRSALNLIFPLVTFPYVSRILSVDSMGIYNFANTYTNYFILLAGLGISTYAVREGAKYRDDREKISKFSSQIFSINIIATIIAYVLLVLSLLLFGNLHNYISAILVFSLQILFTTIGTEWIYTIYEEYSYITVRSIIFKIISIVLLFILVRKSSDYLWYAGITVFASVGSNILNYIHAKSFVTIKIVKNAGWKNHLKPILVIFASSVATTLYVSSDTLILGFLKSDYDVGIYGLSVKIYTIVSGLIAGLLAVTIPRLAMLIGKKRVKEYILLLKRVLNILIVAGLPATIGLVMLSKEVILIIAGKKYLDGIFSLQIISWAMLFSNLAMIFNQCILIPTKRESKALVNTIITGGINVAINFVFIPIWSFDGAAFSTVIAELMIMILNAYASKDYVEKIITRQVKHNLLTSFIGCLGIILICILLKIGIHSLILRTILSVLLSVIIYGAILVLSKNELVYQLLEKYIKRN